MAGQEVADGLEFGAVAGLRRFLPRGDGAVVLDLFQSAKHWLVGEVVEFLAAEIVVAPLHVADAQISISIRKQRPLQRGDVLKKKLLLQILRAG